MKANIFGKYLRSTGRTAFFGVLSAIAVVVSACSDKGADKDISEIINAWKTADQSQTDACRDIYTVDLADKKQADTSKDCQESYMDFLGTLNALRNYATNNPSTRVEIRNTIYEVYGKMLYGSDKKEYLEAEAINAIRKAVPLNDQTLLAELYKMMADLTKDEPLRSAIYDTKAIDILLKKGRDKEFYAKEDYAKLASIFYKEGDYRDAIKYGNLWLASPKDTGKLSDEDMAVWDLVGSSYMEINQWDSSSVVFDGMMGECANASDSTKWYDIAKGKSALVKVKWQQYSSVEEDIEHYLQSSLAKKDTANVIRAYLGKGMGLSSTGNDKKALAELKQARRYATTKRFPSLQMKTYAELARVFEAAGQDDSSSVCKRKLEILEGKINTSRQDVELLKTKTEHELLQIQNDIESAHYEKVSKRSWSWLIILIAILLAIIAYLFWGRKRFRVKIHKRLARQQEEKQKKTAASELDSMAARLKDGGFLDESGNMLDLSSEEMWMNFRQKFSAAHPQFFANLDKALGKKATPAYEKVSALLYIGMDNTRIGNILNISKDSVARCKRRIRTDIGCEDLLKAISEM